MVTYKKKTLEAVDGDHPHSEMMAGAVLDVQRHVVIVVVV